MSCEITVELKEIPNKESLHGMDDSRMCEDTVWRMITFDEHAEKWRGMLLDQVCFRFSRLLFRPLLLLRRDSLLWMFP